MNLARTSVTENPKTSPGEAKKPLDGNAVAKRLQQELMTLMTGGDQEISAFPDGDSLYSWVGTIKVSLKTPFGVRLSKYLC